MNSKIGKSTSQEISWSYIYISLSFSLFICQRSCMCGGSSQDFRAAGKPTDFPDLEIVCAFGRISFASKTHTLSRQKNTVARSQGHKVYPMVTTQTWTCSCPRVEESVRRQLHFPTVSNVNCGCANISRADISCI